MNARTPSTSDLRKFGISMAAAFLLLFWLVLPWIFSFERLPWPLVVAACFGGAGLIAPCALRPLYGPWMAFARIMGKVNATVLLTVLFFLVITPVALIMRVIDRDTMARTFDSESDSYRVEPHRDYSPSSNMDKPY